MPVNSRRKGHNFEREVAVLFREHGFAARRGLQYRDGSECPDVITDLYWVECKRGRKPNIRAAVEQATIANNGQKTPVIIVKDDNQPPIAVMLLDDWFSLATGGKSDGK